MARISAICRSAFREAIQELTANPIRAAPMTRHVTVSEIFFCKRSQGTASAAFPGT
jgi:hypothetical protein